MMDETGSSGPAAAPSPSTPAEQDAAIAALRAGAERWRTTTPAEQVRLLEALVLSIEAAADRWVAAGCALKGVARGAHAEAEEWLGGPYTVLRAVRQLIRSLKDLGERGAPALPGVVRALPGGQVAAPVFPADPLDRILLRGISAEVWLDPEVALGEVKDNMAGAHRGGARRARVGLVLGAGNVTSIGPMDVLHKLFSKGECAVLKMNPVNQAAGPALEEALSPLIDADLLRLLYGGAEVGERLCQHGGIDSIHVTGSLATHDRVVWGEGDEALERKRAGTPRNDRPVTSELGNVSPVIVVPGPWSKGDLRYHGENLASSLTTNAGFNCNATRVILTHGGWAQRDELLGALREALGETEPRPAYYPGQEEQRAAFLDAHPDATRVGDSEAPWLLAAGLDPAERLDPCFQHEFWCGAMAEAPVPAADPAEFIRKAVRFANEVIAGSLNVTLLVHPASLRDPAVARAVERAITDLRYGTVAVNLWAAASFPLGGTTWGAFPGNSLDDAGSGIGTVHNTFLFDRPQKTVLRAPFRIFPRPAWFTRSRSGPAVGRHMTALAARPTVTRLVRVLLAALGLGQ